MIEVLTVENMRSSDAQTIQNGVPGRVLMKRAGEAIFQAVKWQGPVAIVCGIGNNAGDGYVIAECLKQAQIPCTLFLLSDRFSEDGKYYFDICQEAKIPIVMLNEKLPDGAFKTIFDGFEMIVDCIFGTGMKGSVKGLEKAVIQTINHTNKYTISVDINSGLNGDNGLAGGTYGNEEICVESDLTISIGSFQPGHFLGEAKDVMKEKINVDIGIKPMNTPYQLLEKEDIKQAFPSRKNLSNKGTYGYVTLIGGSEQYSGAIRLAAMSLAALRSGAGVATVAVPKSIAPIVATNALESTIEPIAEQNGQLSFEESTLQKIAKRSKTVAFGMGIGQGEGAEKSLVWLLGNYDGRLLIDADGLNLLAKMAPEIVQNTGAKLVLTPHVKEFSRLLIQTKKREVSIAEIMENPILLAKEYAKEMQVVLLLKGPTTIVTDGTRVFLVDKGCPGMATAGSGDVLSGILSALLSYNEDLTFSTAAGAYLNGLAGELAQKKINSISMIAGDTVNQIPAAITQIIS